MEFDVVRLTGAVTRKVEERDHDGRPARVVIAQRTYDADIDEVWDAITNAERIPRWLMPISGELKLGGRYQLEGNAGGEILRCEEPTALAVTWEYGGDVSWLEVQLTATDDGTELTLEHMAHVNEHWGEYGPGAVGVGWDMALVGLGEHLDTGGSITPEESMAWLMSDNGKEFVKLTSAGWGQAAIEAGDDEADARSQAENTRAAYTGETGPSAESADTAPAGPADEPTEPPAR